jgi:ribosome-associated toxin RatA of RatAB toxin-antitoxin module
MFFPPRNAPVTAGGRPCARRLLAWALAMAVVALPASAASQDPQVTVREEDGLFRVAAMFTVPQPGSVAMAVLTDYEHIPRFMPDVRASSVLDRNDERVVVEQEAVARLMMFSKRIHLVLEVHETPGHIRFHDRCGKSFARYEGGWTVTEKGGVTSIAYELIADPSFDVPEFLLKRLLKRDSTRMIGKLQAEIAARTR